MKKFLVLPRESSGAFGDLSPEDMQRIVMRYYEWTQKLAEAGRLEMGEKLADGEGRVLRGPWPGTTVTDGPYSESKEVIGGLWLLNAEDYQECLTLVSDCPHLDYGSLEIRAIDDYRERM